MKKNTRALILFFVALAIFAFNRYQSRTEKENTNKEIIVNSISDSVKIVTDGNLNVYYLDVGQADSILLENNGNYMLIDAGNDADEDKLVRYFNNMGITTFEYVIATHAHEDHIGGIDGVIRNFEVKNFYMPDVITTTKTFENVLDALEEKSIDFQTPEIGKIFLFGGCKMEVLHIGQDEDDLNDTSIVVRGLYGDNSFLFMGDATSNVEKKILNDNIDSDVLKVGHHGSQYSSMVKFLNKVTPEYAIISVGKDNSYGHPKKATLDKLENINAKVYRTDVYGTIVASSDGKKITFTTKDTDLDG